MGKHPKPIFYQSWNCDKSYTYPLFQAVIWKPELFRTPLVKAGDTTACAFELPAYRASVSAMLYRIEINNLIFMQLPKAFYCAYKRMMFLN